MRVCVCNFRYFNIFRWSTNSYEADVLGGWNHDLEYLLSWYWSYHAKMLKARKCVNDETNANANTIFLWQRLSLSEVTNKNIQIGKYAAENRNDVITQLK